MQLEKNIGELLYCHDCVIVPEFGGFVANYRSAWIDELRQKVHPPSKEIGFNRNLNRNDGLLVDHLAQSESITFNEAGELIADEVGTWNKRLESGEAVELSGVGRLYFDRARNLQFDPESATNYLTSSFAMGAVQLPQLKAEPEVIVPAEEIPEPQPVIIPLAEAQEEETEEQPISMVPAIAATLILLVSMGIWMNMRTNVIKDGMATLSGIDLFRSTPAATYTEHTLERIVDPGKDDVALELPTDESYFTYSFIEHGNTEKGRVIEWKVPEMAVPVNTAVITPRTEERYHVVGGCFGEEQNAVGLIEKLQAEGYEPRLIDEHRGLHRVAVGSYKTKQQALRALAAIRKEHTPSAWLLVK